MNSYFQIKSPVSFFERSNVEMPAEYRQIIEDTFPIGDYDNDGSPLKFSEFLDNLQVVKAVYTNNNVYLYVVDVSDGDCAIGSKKLTEDEIKELSTVRNKDKKIVLLRKIFGLEPDYKIYDLKDLNIKL